MRDYFIVQCVTFLVNQTLTCKLSIDSTYDCYWCVKGRRDLNTTSTTACPASLFIWDTDNSVIGQLLALYWENMIWLPGQPNGFYKSMMVAAAILSFGKLVFLI